MLQDRSDLKLRDRGSNPNSRDEKDGHVGSQRSDSPCCKMKRMVASEASDLKARVARSIGSESPCCEIDRI